MLHEIIPFAVTKLTNQLKRINSDSNLIIAKIEKFQGDIGN